MNNNFTDDKELHMTHHESLIILRKFAQILMVKEKAQVFKHLLKAAAQFRLWIGERLKPALQPREEESLIEDDSVKVQEVSFVSKEKFPLNKFAISHSQFKYEEVKES